MSASRTVLIAILAAACTPASGRTTLPASDTDWILPGDQPTSTFGVFLGPAGDLDADGCAGVLIGDSSSDGAFDDVTVAAPRCNSGGSSVGGVQVFHGGPFQADRSLRGRGSAGSTVQPRAHLGTRQLGQRVIDDPSAAGFIPLSHKNAARAWSIPSRFASACIVPMGTPDARVARTP